MRPADKTHRHMRRQPRTSPLSSRIGGVPRSAVLALAMLVSGCSELQGDEERSQRLPLFHESFDETTLDRRARVHGSGPPGHVPGVLGQGADFSGSRALCFPAAGAIDPAEGTLEFWAKTPEANGLGFFDLGGLGNANSWGVFIARDHWIFELKDRRNRLAQAWMPAPGIRHDGRWHLVTAVWERDDEDVTHFKICRDGRCKAAYDGRIAQSLPDTSGEFCVGWSGWYGFSESHFDEIRIEDYAKNDAAIAAAYRERESRRE